MIDRYEIIYDYCDEWSETCNIVDYFDGSFNELQEYLKSLRKNDCYNITWSYIYSYNEVLGE